jgi:hypothetical protein
MAVQFTYVPIATQTLGSATSSVTFSSIPSTYQDLVVVGSVKLTTGANSGMGIRFNSDSGSNYSYTILEGNGSSAASNRYSNQTYGTFAGSYAEPEAANTFAPHTLHLLNYANTSTYKTHLIRWGNAGNATTAGVSLWRSTAAVNTINIYAYAGNIDVGSTFNLYGLAAA